MKVIFTGFPGTNKYPACNIRFWIVKCYLWVISLCCIVGILSNWYAYTNICMCTFQNENRASSPQQIVEKALKNSRVELNSSQQEILKRLAFNVIQETCKF